MKLHICCNFADLLHCLAKLQQICNFLKLQSCCNFAETSTNLQNCNKSAISGNCRSVAILQKTQQICKTATNLQFHEIADLLQFCRNHTKYATRVHICCFFKQNCNKYVFVCGFCDRHELLHSCCDVQQNCNKYAIMLWFVISHKLLHICRTCGMRHVARHVLPMSSNVTHRLCVRHAAVSCGRALWTMIR